ncbi:hypothetical protein AVEN_71539-1 [Araneus ventricosus]|uniref:Uncharacterized protein n=1 Tax=Araneus ventricosus TaxID=182803 RepID=A0A4Y2PGR5_ARAVE|nr:hypothetical protein AVEN_71539-1 [Araneus ventricosus]
MARTTSEATPYFRNIYGIRTRGRFSHIHMCTSPTHTTDLNAHEPPFPVLSCIFWKVIHDFSTPDKSTHYRSVRSPTPCFSISSVSRTNQAPYLRNYSRRFHAPALHPNGGMNIQTG